LRRAGAGRRCSRSIIAPRGTAGSLLFLCLLRTIVGNEDTVLFIIAVRNFNVLGLSKKNWNCCLNAACLFLDISLEIGGNYHNEGKYCKPQVCAVLIVGRFTAKCDRFKWQTHVTLKNVAFFWED
jgi:hypothetical protein